MSFETWIAFVIASIILTLIPGPSVLLVISQALTRGKNAAMVCILGDMVGTIVLMALSFLGVGALLAASAVLFQLMKWAGVLYLAYLGYCQILEARKEEGCIQEKHLRSSSSWGSFWAGSITAVLNPKAIIFYVAFLAQFIDPNADIILQATILTTTSIMVVAVLLTGYAFMAVHAGVAFQTRSVRKKVGYAGGGLMIGGSVLMAATR